jgi:hypothetical protein
MSQLKYSVTSGSKEYCGEIFCRFDGGGGNNCSFVPRNVFRISSSKLKNPSDLEFIEFNVSFFETTSDTFFGNTNVPLLSFISPGGMSKGEKK